MKRKLSKKQLAALKAGRKKRMQNLKPYSIGGQKVRKRSRPKATTKKTVRSTTRRYSGTKFNTSKIMSNLQFALFGVIGAIGAGMLANSIPTLDKKLRSAMPIVAGIAISGLNLKGQIWEGMSLGMMIAGSVSVIKQFVPDVPVLAGEIREIKKIGYPYELKKVSGQYSISEQSTDYNDPINSGIFLTSADV